jgi:hypothetical protein
MIPKSKRSPAERAAEWVLAEMYGCRYLRRAIRSQYQKVDFWGSDVMGRTESGMVFYAQVTTGGPEAVRQRRRKLEQIPWNEHERPMLFVLHAAKDGRQVNYYFEIQHLVSPDMAWITESPVDIKDEWWSKYDG